MKVGEIFATLSIKQTGTKDVENFIIQLNNINNQLNIFGGHPKGGGKNLTESAAGGLRSLISPFKSVGGVVGQTALAISALTVGVTALLAVAMKLVSVTADDAQSLERFGITTGTGDSGKEMIQKLERLAIGLKAPISPKETRSQINSFIEKQNAAKLYGENRPAFVNLGLEVFKPWFDNFITAIINAQKFEKEQPGKGSMLLQGVGIDPAWLQADFSKGMHAIEKFTARLSTHEIDELNKAFVTLREATYDLVTWFARGAAWLAEKFNWFIDDGGSKVSVNENAEKKKRFQELKREFGYADDEPVTDRWDETLILRKIEDENKSWFRRVIDHINPVKRFERGLEDFLFQVLPPFIDGFRGGGEGDENNVTVNQTNNISVTSTAPAEIVADEISHVGTQNLYHALSEYSYA